jgi:hypothetical protein
MSCSKRKVRYLHPVEEVKIASESQAVGEEFIDINEAASLYGCQINRIRNLMTRGMLHPFFDKREIEKLRQKHLYQQINGRLNQ